MASFASLLELTILTALSALLYLTWAKRRNSRLPPGPLGLPLLGSLPFLSPNLNFYLAGLARTYGPVLSLWLGSKLCIVLTSPSAAQAALKDHDVVFANHDVPDVAPYGGADMLWAPYGPHWQMLRKVSVRELLSTGGIEATRPLRRREVRRAVAEMCARAGESVEVRELVFTTALGVIRRMLWGEGVEAQGDEREFREVVEGAVELLGSPNVSDFFPALARWDLQGVRRRMEGFTARFDRLFDDMVERRMRAAGGGDSGPSFLQVLLELMATGDTTSLLTMENVKALLLRMRVAVGGDSGRSFLQVLLEIVAMGDIHSPLTMEQIKDMVAAGTDTTSSTVEWAMAELLCNPNKMRKVQEEIDAVVGKNRVLEESDIPQLQFLKATVKEALRLHPVIPLLVPHCPSSDCIVCGYRVPKGAKVFINVWAIQRDPTIWEDPLEFKPERFIDTTEKYDYNGTNFSYLPFGSGRRVCVGISLGEKMVLYMLASMLHSFDWRLPDGAKLDLQEKFGIVLNIKEPLVAVPSVRLDDPELYA